MDALINSCKHIGFTENNSKIISELYKESADFMQQKIQSTASITPISSSSSKHRLSSSMIHSNNEEQNSKLKIFLSHDFHEKMRDLNMMRTIIQDPKAKYKSKKNARIRESQLKLMLDEMVQKAKKMM